MGFYGDLSSSLPCLPWLQVAWVPGSFEIPLVAQEMAQSGKFHAVLCIGAVVSDALSDASGGGE